MFTPIVAPRMIVARCGLLLIRYLRTERRYPLEADVAAVVLIALESNRSEGGKKKSGKGGREKNRKSFSVLSR